MNDTSDSPQHTQAEELIELSRDIPLLRTPGGEAYADLPMGDHVETHPLKSTAMRGWLTLRYFEAHRRAPSKNALDGVLGVLAAQAQFRSSTDEVHIRLAWHDYALYLDLHENGVVRVTEDGWTMLDNSERLPVRFRRPRGALPLPRPERGGSLKELRPFLNLPEGHDRAWVLTVGWLLGALHPTGPYPLLALHGEKGSAKSTTTRYLRELIDPSAAPAPVQPRDSSDLTLKANNNWVVAFDNMSGMPRWLSDGLCRLSTGAGDSKRELYADSEEIIFAAKRPCIINGIEELATAGDLLDRTVIVTLPVIPEERRQSDAGMNAAFEEARPRILGALLDAISNALVHQESVHLERAPRMRDFAEWVVAAEMSGGLPWPAGSFLGAYMGNRAEAQLLEIESSPVATAVRAFMEARRKALGNTPWTGAATLLRELLAEHIDDETRRRNYSWPKNGKTLSDRLTRDAGALRSIGIEIERGKSGDHRTLTLRWRTADDIGDVEREHAGGEETLDNERGDTPDALDAENRSFPFSSYKKREEGKRGKARERASAASTTAAADHTTPADSDDEDEEDVRVDWGSPESLDDVEF